MIFSVIFPQLYSWSFLGTETMELLAERLEEMQFLSLL